MNPSTTNLRICQARRNTLHEAARRRAHELRDQAMAEFFSGLAGTARCALLGARRIASRIRGSRGRA
jgi:hypothetical protein